MMPFTNTKRISSLAITLVLANASLGCADSDPGMPVEARSPVVADARGADPEVPSAPLESAESTPPWRATTEDGACVARSAAVLVDSAISVRGEQYLQVSHLPPARFFDVLFVVPGYDYARGSKVRAELPDGRTFELETEGYKAYADPETSKAFVAALGGSDTLSVTGTSAAGVTATDRYTLASFPEAYAEINRTCNKPTTRRADRAPAQSGAAQALARAVAYLMAQATTLEETVRVCRPIVDVRARDLVDVAWGDWKIRNQDDLAVLDRARSELIVVAKENGVVTEIAVRMSAGAKEAKRVARQTIESLPSDRHAPKCYGILVELNEGGLDLAETSSDALRALRGLGL